MKTIKGPGIFLAQFAGDAAGAGQSGNQRVGVVQHRQQMDRRMEEAGRIHPAGAGRRKDI